MSDSYMLPLGPALLIMVIGLVLMFFGGWLNYRGLRDGPLAALVGGWFIMVAGMTLLLLVALPYVAEALALLLGFEP